MMLHFKILYAYILQICTSPFLPHAFVLPNTLMAGHSSVKRLHSDLQCKFDWDFIARLLGLTGPNGTFFQQHLSQQFWPHTPWLLQKIQSLHVFFPGSIQHVFAIAVHIRW